MPRVARAIETGCPHHAMSRGNGRMTLFHKPADYDAFARLLDEGLERHAVDLFAYCLMPNHWHRVLWPAGDRELSAFVRLLGFTHTQRRPRPTRRTAEGTRCRARTTRTARSPTPSRASRCG